MTSLSEAENTEGKSMYLAYSASQRRLAEDETHEVSVLSDAETAIDAVLSLDIGSSKLVLPCYRLAD